MTSICFEAFKSQQKVFQRLALFDLRFLYHYHMAFRKYILPELVLEKMDVIALSFKVWFYGMH